MKALVTGGGGFIGAHVVRQLRARGDQVRVFCRGDYPELAAHGVELVRGDLADGNAVAAACAGVDCVFHVAAKAGVWGDYAGYHAPNVEGTRHVVDGCRRHDVPRLVFTSSPSVVFDNRAHRGEDETLPYPEHYENPYSQTKAEAERLVLGASDGRLRATALRPHLVFGPGDPHLLPRVVAKGRRRQLVQVGDGENRVDLTYVEDAARAHLLAADALERNGSAAGRAYFITQGEPVNLWNWVRELLAALDLPGPTRRVSAGTAHRIGAFLECTHRLLHLPGEPRLTRFVASELALDHYYDISAAERDLGYRPERTMAQALELTLPDLRARFISGTGT
ncbi:MAG: NAD-dependent epimerase/dehydratase family protein [Gammaproteobacteria bacterium]|nr:NAD-dependent epimerase/dehydratase family protein [Gammaproteobacteria bacterium]